MTDKKQQLISDAEEEQIQKLIASDPDAPEVTDVQIAEARPFTEAFPVLAKKMHKNVGGRPKASNPKVPVSIRLDRDVVAKLRATGPGWQSRVNEMLRREVLSEG
ncbi:MAG: BrnA antitoxin family protein [Paracoccaceae bacterium]